MKLLSNLLIVLSVLFSAIGIYYLWLIYSPNSLKFTNYEQQVSPKVNYDKKSNLPERIVIKDIGINTPVSAVTVQGDKWYISRTGASYLASSSIPGDTGNSIIYGHNWISIFGNLTKAKPGQTVEITYSNKTKKEFTIEYTSVVSSSESGALAESNDKRITLYTCTGFLDSKRFVAVAFLK